MSEEGIKRTEQESRVGYELAKAVANRVASCLAEMRRGQDEAINYYSTRTNDLANNALYFRGLRDGQEDAIRTVRSAIFATLTNSEMEALLGDGKDN